MAIFSSAEAASTRAIGSTYDGSIQEALDIQTYIGERSAVEFVSPREFQYSTQEIAGLLVDTAKWVNAQWGLSLRIGDLSLKNGGPMAVHVNHQNGLDADIGYLGKRPKPHGHRKDKYNNRFPEDFVTHDETVSDNFDYDKNFKLMAYILEHHPVAVMLSSKPIIRALITRDVPGMTWETKQQLLNHLVHRRGHTDHFHVQLKCPPTHRDCKSEGPVWKNPPNSQLVEHCPKEHPKCVQEMTEGEFRTFSKRIDAILEKSRKRSAHSKETEN